MSSDYGLPIPWEPQPAIGSIRDARKALIEMDRRAAEADRERDQLRGLLAQMRETLDLICEESGPVGSYSIEQALASVHAMAERASDVIDESGVLDN